MCFRFGLPETATANDKRYFVTSRLAFSWCFWCEEQWKDNTLSNHSAEYFCLFGVAMSRQSSHFNRSKLLDLLVNRGLYVPKGQNTLICDALFSFVKWYIPNPTLKPVTQDVSTMTAYDDTPQNVMQDWNCPNSVRHVIRVNTNRNILQKDKFLNYLQDIQFY